MTGDGNIERRNICWVDALVDGVGGTAGGLCGIEEPSIRDDLARERETGSLGNGPDKSLKNRNNRIVYWVRRPIGVWEGGAALERALPTLALRPQPPKHSPLPPNFSQEKRPVSSIGAKLSASA